MLFSELTGDGFAWLWETAQAREREHDDSGAAQAYAELLRLHLQSRRSPKPYLLVRIARSLFRVELFSPAGRLLDAVRTLLVEKKDDPGVFWVDLRRCELALLSSNRFRAARVLARASDARGPLGRVGPRHLHELEQRLSALSWPSVSSQELAQARLDARVMLSRLWASSGRFLPAIEMLRRALSDAHWRELVYRREGLFLLMAEHYLDRGDLASAEWLITRHLEPREGAPLPSTSDAFRWKVLQVRLSCLRGRFGKARHLMVRLLRDSEQEGAPEDVLQASWWLAQCLLFLNRTREVESLIQRSQERLAQTEAGRVWAARFESLRESMERRRRAANEELIRPFAPEETASLRFMDADPLGNGAAGVGSRGVHGAPAVQRTRERFAEDWARLANQVMENLEDGTSSGAIHALAALERLAARTDSSRLVGRTYFHEGLVAYYRGELEEAKTFFSHAVETAHTQGCVFDEWQALGFLAWTCARLGEDASYADCAQRARVLLDGLVADMDAEDRIFFRLNKWSAQDEYLAALARAVPREVPSHASRFSRWRGRREIERATLEVYRALSCLTGWDVERRLEEPGEEGEEAPSRASTPSQVEAWVRTQLQLPVHGRAGRASLRGLDDSRWLLWHIPRSVAVLHFYVMADRTLTFVLGQRRIELHTLPLSRERLWRCALEVLDEIPRQVRPFLRGAEAVERSLKALSSALELEQLLGGLPSYVERLVIIPHDVLANLPFPALFLGGSHLCERFACSLMPHLGWLSSWRHRRARPLKVRKFLGVGVSTYAGVDLGPLPGAVDEPGELAPITSAPHAVVLKDDGAGLENVTQLLESTEWAHLACHGRFEPEAPHRSCLYLGREEGRSSVLSLARVQQLRLDRLRLAVLASCWSSSASTLPGNELVCIPAAFLRAGSSAVVASLWEVDNVLALPFMKQVYAEIAQHGVAAGLARAQRRWAREAPSEEARATFFWGGYLAYGNG
ncbi:CHAT domain-containing protein [Archangium minus]|uniref:CHAT domain-containing protein n=1 Tax=Archangium minus TaxID=83450 RepID=A0ABY9WZB5_9BACT|nr:CHAT domain-containing protein [Archangium minus]